MGLRRRPGPPKRTTWPSGPERAADRPASALDRYAAATRRVLVASEAQAQADASTAIELHHLLLALTAVPTPVAWALATAGIDEASLRDALDRAADVPHPPGERRIGLVPSPEIARVPFSEPAKQVLVAAIPVAQQRGSRRVEPVHLAHAVLAAGAPTVVASLGALDRQPADLAARLDRA